MLCPLSNLIFLVNKEICDVGDDATGDEGL